MRNKPIKRYFMRYHDDRVQLCVQATSIKEAREALAEATNKKLSDIPTKLYWEY